MFVLCCTAAAAEGTSSSATTHTQQPPATPAVDDGNKGDADKIAKHWVTKLHGKDITLEGRKLFFDAPALQVRQYVDVNAFWAATWYSQPFGLYVCHYGACLHRTVIENDHGESPYVEAEGDLAPRSLNPIEPCLIHPALAACAGCVIRHNGVQFVAIVPGTMAWR